MEATLGIGSDLCVFRLYRARQGFGVNICEYHHCVLSYVLAILEWKGTTDLLAMRAEDSESYASAREALAEVGIGQAWEAVLGTIEAQREAEEAAATIPSKPA
jgi:hypothetical protein